VEITAPRDLPVGRDVTLNADVSWLVCSDQICIPEQGTLSLTLHAAARGNDDPAGAPRIAVARATLPQIFTGEARITGGNPATLSIAIADAASMRAPEFFAYDASATDHAAPTTASHGAQGLSLSIKPGVDGLGGKPLNGVLVYEDASGARHAL